MEESSPDMMLDPPSHRFDFNPGPGEGGKDEAIINAKDNQDVTKARVSYREEEKVGHVGADETKIIDASYFNASASGIG